MSKNSITDTIRRCPYHKAYICDEVCFEEPSFNKNQVCGDCKHPIFWDELKYYWYCKKCNGEDLDHGCKPKGLISIANETKRNWYCSALRTSHRRGGICTRLVKKGERCFQHPNQPTYSIGQYMIEERVV